MAPPRMGPAWDRGPFTPPGPGPGLDHPSEGPGDKEPSVVKLQIGTSPSSPWWPPWALPVTHWEICFLLSWTPYWNH